MVVIHSNEFLPTVLAGAEIAGFPGAGAVLLCGLAAVLSAFITLLGLNTSSAFVGLTGSGFIS